MDRDEAFALVRARIEQEEVPTLKGPVGSKPDLLCSPGGRKTISSPTGKGCSHLGISRRNQALYKED